MLARIPEEAVRGALTLYRKLTSREQSDLQIDEGVHLVQSASNVRIEFPKKIIQVLSKSAIRELDSWRYPDVGDRPDRFELILPRPRRRDSRFIILCANPYPLIRQTIHQAQLDLRDGRRHHERQNVLAESAFWWE